MVDQNNLNQDVFLSIFHSILPEITPSAEEKVHIQSVIAELVSLIRSERSPEQIKINFIEPQGSTGIKDTALRNAADIDLFIGLSPDSILSQNFKSKMALMDFLHPFFKNLCLNWLIPLLNKAGISDIVLAYAEHPYLSIKYKELEIDLVFCFDLPASFIEEKGPISAVDRSPHHSRFIRNHLTPEQRNDVLLLKHFFKCNFIYGDKSPIGLSGFTGYSAELLITYYGSILNLFSNFHQLGEKIIGFENWEKKRQNLNIAPNSKLFTNDFLQIVDPTDSNRNVGSSISPRCYFRAKVLIERFLDQPQKHFFSKKALPLISSQNCSEQEKSNFFYILFQQSIEDHYTKYRDKCYSQLNRFIQSSLWEPFGFPKFLKVVGELIFEPDNGLYCISFFTSTPEIEPKYLRKGPHKDDFPHNNKFFEKNPTAFIRDEHIWVEVERPFRQFSKYLESYFQGHPIKGLDIIRIGKGIDIQQNTIEDRSMGILYDGVIPYINWDDILYQKSPFSVDSNQKHHKSNRIKKKKK